jgi:hypothetical protein
MPDLKQQLVEMIEAFAAAKAAGNARLVQIAATDLSAFLQQIELASATEAAAELSVDPDEDS